MKICDLININELPVNFDQVRFFSRHTLYGYDCCTYFQSITKIGQYHLAVTSETF